MSERISAAKTAQGVLNRVRDRLEEAGIEEEAWEAAQIVGHVLGLSWGQAILLRSERVAPEAASRIEQITLKRAQRRPLQYILGECAFRDLVLRIDERALVPRPETELLVDEAKDRLPPAAGAGRDVVVADLCCGCGAVGLALAAELSGVKVVMTDASPEALELAEENRRGLGALGEGVELRCGRDLEPLAGLEGRLDAIVCNPPYVASEDIDGLQPELQHEPRLALDGGPDGLSFYRRLAGAWDAFVRPGGFLAVEVGLGQAADVRELLSPRTAAMHTRTDLSGIERIVVVERSARGGSAEEARR